MNSSINYSKDAAVTEQQQCSEKSCATCFENRGCMYEQYLAVVIHNIEGSYQAKHIDQASQQISKRA